MVTKEYSEGLAEVLAILDNTEIEYVNKIPEKVRRFFKENASKDYIPNINMDSEIKDMDLKKETKHILSVRYINYWTENQEEKREFTKILKDNQKAVDNEIREKYNPDKIFDNQSEVQIKPNLQESVLPEESLVVQKESFFGKLILKIKSWILRLNKKL